jgi:sarcosine oxidase subunit gamma
MAERITRASAFTRLEPRAGAGEVGVTIAECRHRALVTLGGPVEDELFRAAARAAIGCELVRTAGGVSSGAGGRSVLWLGPAEWLIVIPDGDGWVVERALGQALGQRGGKAIDVSQGRAVLRLAGPLARDLLAKFCPIDLHPIGFPAGRCAQTLFGKIGALLHALPDGTGFDIYVSRSYADDFAASLCAAARDSGYRIGPPVA